ncbi:MAG: ParA family protein [Lachnospiraceae bacterium]|nr:ParA family protein [Lachnospiraceae bacterium]
MGKIIAVLNEKGGVAKTTTVKNLAGGLSRMGKSVLAVDLDSSANLTKSLGLVPTEESGSIVEIMDKAIEFEDVPKGYGILHHEEGMDVIPSSNRFLRYSDRIGDVMRREEVLERYLQSVRDDYDYILIDCPGGLEIFTQNALFACDYIVIPSEAKKLSIEAMQNIFLMVGQVRKLKRTEAPIIAGVLFCKVRANTANDREVMKAVRSKYGERVHVFEHYIPLATVVADSDVACESLFKLAPNSTAAVEYQAFIDELLAVIEEGD